ncbi:MAG: Hsp70 family protein [Lachnospiraceae bacterium]|nr:Hsp70 family protein [Lachnospiraceae bacterium]
MRVGIDLGTTYCAIAYVDPKNGQAKVIRNSEGSPITPSVLYFDPDGAILHGEDAKAFLEEGSERTVNYFKYHMGDDTYSVFQNGREYTATDLSAELLKGLVREAEDEVGENIHEAVITVPAYFDHFRRQATMEAGQKAGLKVLSIISEPTAAVFAYGIHGKGTNQTVLVYDLGGGTFDVTIARITDDEIKVLGTDGDHQLGGKDWDDALANYLTDQFEEEYGIDISGDVEMNIMLQAIAEKTKKQLSERPKSKATITYEGHKGTFEITQGKFEEITAYNLRRTKDIIEKLLSELKMGWEGIDGVLLVGGSTRMKQVKDYLTEMCGRPPMQGVNVDEAVALGAAIRANIDLEGNVVEEAVRPMMLGGPARKPSFAIAGAKRIKDATAHSMGMIAVNKEETAYVNSIMVKKNSSIPTQVTKSYELGISQHEENRLEVYMLQGEEEALTYPLNCIVLGKYVFTGMDVGGERKEEIKVTFAYDANNIVQVSAIQERTGRELSLHIEPVEEDMSWVLENPRERQRAASGQPDMSVLLAIDLSGSMSGNRLEEAKKAAVSFVEQFDLGYTQIGLINFSDRSVLYQPLCRNRELLKQKIRAWKINDGGLGYGNSAEPFALANSTLAEWRQDVRYLVVLTDGYWSYEEDAIELAQKCHREGIEVIALGFGSANKRFLDEIASRKDFASFTDVSKLETALTGIAKIM